MKKTAFFLWATLSAMAMFAYSPAPYTSVDRLTVGNPGIVTILQRVHNAEKDIYEDLRDELFLVLRVEEKPVGLFEIRVSIVDKTSYGLLTLNAKDKLSGYFDYKGVPVLVFGPKETSLFKKTGQKKTLDFVKQYPSGTGMARIFDPIVRIYRLKDGRVTFQEVYRAAAVLK